MSNRISESVKIGKYFSIGEFNIIGKKAVVDSMAYIGSDIETDSTYVGIPAKK